MTAYNMESGNNKKKELPDFYEEPRPIKDCYLTKFEAVLLAMIIASVLLYTTHLIISSYATRVPDFCYLPNAPGLCRGYFEAWYFDPNDETCKAFIYGGCNGNENNFETEEYCLGNCTRKPLHLGLGTKSNIY